MTPKQKPKHIPVLCDQVLELLDPQASESFFDGTAGYGGHAAAIIEKIGAGGRIILVDQDATAVAALAERFGSQAEVIHDNFATASERLVGNGTLVDMILLDLGVSSPQLDTAERGFSFASDAPLDMRMDQSQRIKASDVVNSYREERLADLIYENGGERKSRAVARAIVAARPLNTTRQLAEVIRKVVRRRPGDKIDPATRTFQAIRIEVNNELANLSDALPNLMRLLTPGGRIAVISFHSGEDTIIKSFFDRESRDCVCPPKQPICTCDHGASLRKLTKGVVIEESELAINPRARSAKLRAAVKLNKHKKEHL